MTKLILVIIIFFISCASLSAQPAMFTDFGPNFSNQLFNDTSKFVGILGASDTTVQQALEDLSLFASTVNAILQCETSDDFCFVYNSTDQQLVLYVNGAIQVKYPQTAAVAGTDVLLLESGDKLLLENGVDSILLEN